MRPSKSGSSSFYIHHDPNFMMLLSKMLDFDTISAKCGFWWSFSLCVRDIVRQRKHDVFSIFLDAEMMQPAKRGP